jgi:agmatine deiminase
MDATLITVLTPSGEWGTMWVDMVETFTQDGHVMIIAPEGDKTVFEAALDNAGIAASAYSWLNYPVNSIWVRDYGPEFAVAPDGERFIMDSYYAGRPLDDAVPILMGAGDWLNSDGSPVEVNSVDHMLSGGNVMSDGAGTCFFSDIVYGYEKPAGWTNAEVDDLMAEYLGCEQIVTLKPICLDMTGHIDLYAKLLGPTAMLLIEWPADTHFDGTVASGVSAGHCASPGMPNDYQDQEDNLATIAATSNLDGDPWVVTRAPIPEPFQQGGEWVYRSYMNSEIMNNWVAMPSFYDPKGDETAQDLLDMEALAIDAYEAAAPGINVVAIDVDHMNGTGGAIHCISHDIPAEAGGGWEIPAEYCGDGARNGDEECDGDDFGGDTCEEYGSWDVDLLACNPDCTVDASGCPSAECGDGDVDEGEECDPCAPEQDSCDAYGLGSGFVGCDLDCTIAYRNCPDATDCEVAALIEPGVVCCPDAPPADCAAGSWSWSPEDSYYGCCTADLKNMIYCDGATYNDWDCTGTCGFITDGPFVDCTDDPAPEEAAPDIDCDVDTDGDTDTDTDADAGTGGGDDDDCDCGTAGSPGARGILGLLLASLGA